MEETPASLLDRLRRPGEREAWDRFVELYTPLLYHWARRRLGLQEPDAADLVQDVFSTLLRKMPEFQYDPGRSFRSWLYAVVVNKWHDACRRRAAALRRGGGEAGLEEVAVPDPSAELWQEEYRRHVTARALEWMQAHFEPTTWKACWEMTACGRPAAEVAAELGLTLAAAYAANSRVLRRLRREMDGLLD
jgi:RNA polymerase sigma-70 factor (ECF subfamily)